MTSIARTIHEEAKLLGGAADDPPPMSQCVAIVRIAAAELQELAEELLAVDIRSREAER